MQVVRVRRISILLQTHKKEFIYFEILANLSIPYCVTLNQLLFFNLGSRNCNWYLCYYNYNSIYVCNPCLYLYVLRLSLELNDTGSVILIIL
jgi:hypothetical protein